MAGQPVEDHQGRHAPLRLVEVVAARPSSRPLTVRVGDVSVDVPVGFDEETLARVLGVPFLEHQAPIYQGAYRNGYTTCDDELCSELPAPKGAPACP